MKFWENWKKILKKFKRNWEENLNWFLEKNGNIIGKNRSNSKLMLTTLCRNFWKFFWSNFSEIQKNYEEIKIIKNIENTSHKLLKNILMKILWNFQDDFWKNLRRTTETSNNFIEKLQRTPEKFWKYLGRSWKYTQGRFKA